jgi:hypothetical protein
MAGEPIASATLSICSDAMTGRRCTCFVMSCMRPTVATTRSSRCERKAASRQGLVDGASLGNRGLDANADSSLPSR